LLTESRPRGEFVRYRSPLAARRGIAPEMPVSEARTLVRPRDTLLIEPVQPAPDRAALVELAVLCEAYSFCIGVEDSDRPECLLMDITGVAHFFGDEPGLVRHLQQALIARRLQGRIAIAGTVAAAWAAARWLARTDQPTLLKPDAADTLDRLPVAALRLAEPTLATLARLGLRSIGELRSLDRAAIPSRLGVEPLRRLDQLHDPRLEWITPCRPPPRYRVERRCEEPLAHPDWIEQLWRQALDELLAPLHPRRLGTRRLVGRFDLEPGDFRTLDVRVCTVSDDTLHLGELLRFKLDQARIDAPLVGLALEALEVGPLELAQQTLFDAGPHDRPRPFAMLLNRLSNRLGEQSVVLPVLLPDPIPERSVRLQPVADMAADIAPKPARGTNLAASQPFATRYHALDRPLVLFPQPRPIEVVTRTASGLPATLGWKSLRFEIARHWGPERIETGWWQEPPIARDYYRVETTTGQRLWIFHRLPDQGWFWQGELA
jgi:protein ImuB